jgi:hypothetical protein
VSDSNLPALNFEDLLMREVKLYDRSRTPANWMQIIQPGEFAVFHTNARNGGMTDSSGQYPRQGEEACSIFSSLEAAENYCTAKVLEVPSMRCEIFDSSGRAKPPLRIVVNPGLEKKLDLSPASARNKLALGAALCISSALFFYLDYRAGGGNWFLLTLVGINLAMGGFRVIVWGLGVREQLRDQQRRRGEIIKSASQSGASKGQ